MSRSKIFTLIVGRGLFSKKAARALEQFIEEKVRENPIHMGVVLDCSEFSILIDQFPINSSTQLIDPLGLLAEKICMNLFNQEGKNVS